MSSNESTSNSSLDCCTCMDETPQKSPSNESRSPSNTAPDLKNKKSSLTLIAQNFRRGRSLNFTNKRIRKSCRQPKEPSATQVPSSKNKTKWGMKFNCAKKDRACTEDSRNMKCCVCTCYRRTDEHHLGAGIVFQQETDGQCSKTEVEGKEEDSSEVKNTENSDRPETRTTEAPDEVIMASNNSSDVYGNLGGANGGASIILGTPVDISCLLSRWNTLEFPADDCDEQARLQRAREIEVGVEAPANFRPMRRLQLLYPPDIEQSEGSLAPRRLQLVCPPDLTVDSLKALFQTHVTLRSCPLDSITGCHTQVDYIHCLVPDLLSITNCSFYWGKMDRYEAEKLLDGKPEGTFLLRDSAQEEFLFSVSFRKYGRSLHARIEQWNHKFSFDSHDPSVFASKTVCGLIEHYKDPSSCMFFEPMLTLPLHRNFTFPLQHLCRAVITSRLNYDDVNQLQLPKSLKSYLKEYHYRQKVRVERFDDDLQWIDLRNIN